MFLKRFARIVHRLLLIPAMQPEALDHGIFNRPATKEARHTFPRDS